MYPISIAGITAFLLKKRKRAEAMVRESDPLTLAGKDLQESEERFRRLTNAAFEGIAIHENGVIVDVNHIFPKMFGYEFHELIGKNVLELAAPESRELVLRQVKSGSEIPYEAAGLRKDGTIFWGELSSKSIPYHGRKVRVTVVRDITERKRANETLRESEERFAKAFRSIPDALIISRLEDGMIVEVNNSWHKVFGYSRDEVIGKSSLALNLFANSADRQCAVALLREHGFVRDFELQIRQKSGALRTAILSLELLEIRGEQCMLSVVQDITERKQAEEKILKASRVYAVISQINQTIVRERNRDKLFEEVCRIAIEHGKFKMAWIGLVDEKTKFVDPVTFAGTEDGYLSKIEKISISDLLEGRGTTGTAIREGKHFVCDDIANDPRPTPWKGEALKRGYRSSIALPIKFFGKMIGAFILYAHTPHFFDREEIVLLDEITNDISYALESIETEKKGQEAEEALQASEHRLSSIYDTVGDVIFHLDVEADERYRFSSVNKAFCKVTGLSEDMVVGKLVNEVIPEPSLSMVLGKYKQAIEENAVVRWEETSDYPTGRLTGDVSIAPIVDDGGRCTHLVGAVHDITKRKKAEEKILHQLEELRRWQEITLGREDRIQQLKNEVNELLGRLGETIRYTSQESDTLKDHLNELL